ncbi:MAG: outer membrane beta-barrel protein [Acidobacteriota bacterium]
MRVTFALILTFAAALPLAAQTPRPLAGSNGDAPAVSFRPFFLAVAQRPAASETFDAVFGQTWQQFWGGGVQAAFRSGLFAEVSASRFENTGQRAFVFNGQSFPLGIPLTARITPLEFSAGYRFRTSSRLIPYAAAGIGRYAYVETSDSSDSGDNVDAAHIGYLVLGGVEVRAQRWIGVSVDVQYTHVNGILGSAGISQELGEDNLGGPAVRVKLLVGR